MYMSLGIQSLRSDIDRFFDISVHNGTHNLHLLRHVPKHTAHLSVPFDESEFGVLEPLFSCELFDELACGFEIMTRKTREEVVRHLEMQSSVNKTEVFGADDVCARPHLTIRERFHGAHIRR